MNIISDLTLYISTLNNYATPIIDILLEDEESICVRAEPGSSNEQRDLTGARYGDFQFAIYCKSANPETSITQINYYITALDLNDFTLTDRIKIKCEPITQPHYVSKSENGEVIYTASFHIGYFEGA